MIEQSRSAVDELIDEPGCSRIGSALPRSAEGFIKLAHPAKQCVTVGRHRSTRGTVTLAGRNLRVSSRPQL